MPKPIPGAPPGPAPDRAVLHEAALRHLARYGATEAGLIRVLDRRIARWARAAGATDEAAAPARAAAREVARAMVGVGAIDDAAFAAARARRLLRSGRSRRAVSAHLAAKGVDQETAASALPGGEAEWLAAIVHARKRRIGPFRASDSHSDSHPDSGDGADPERARRELAAMARAGFPRDVAERALALDPDEAATLLLQLKRG